MEKQLAIKAELKEKAIDRRELADKIGVTPTYLNQMLNGWAPLKANYEQAIRTELEKR